MALKGGPGVFTIELRLVGEDTGACLSGGRGRGENERVEWGSNSINPKT